MTNEVQPLDFKFLPASLWSFIDTGGKYEY